MHWRFHDSKVYNTKLPPVDTRKEAQLVVPSCVLKISVEYCDGKATLSKPSEAPEIKSKKAGTYAVFVLQRLSFASLVVDIIQDRWRKVESMQVLNVSVRIWYSKVHKNQFVYCFKGSNIISSPQKNIGAPRQFWRFATNETPANKYTRHVVILFKPRLWKIKVTFWCERKQKKKKNPHSHNTL